jgi:hypothetical protein
MAATADCESAPAAHPPPHPDTVARHLKIVLSSFTNELKELFPSKMELCMMHAIVDALPPRTLADLFSKNVIPVKGLVLQRDEQVILSHGLFEKLGFGDRIAQLWRNDLRDEDKDIVWEWLEHAVKHAETYNNL